MAWYKTTPVQRTPKYNVASGTVANFETNLALPMKSVVANIAPIQDLHGYSKPWAAGAGKNKFDKEDENLQISGYISASKIVADVNSLTVFTKCKPNTTYTVSKTAGNRFIVCWHDQIPNVGDTLSGQIIDQQASAITITTGATASYIVAFVFNASVDTSITRTQMLDSIQIEEGSTATSYEPYANVCPISGTSVLNVEQRRKNLFNPSVIFVAQGSYMIAHNIMPYVRCNMSLIDKDPTVDISGLYFGFCDNDYERGSFQPQHYRWIIDNGNITQYKINTTNLMLLTALGAYPQRQSTIDILLARFDIQIEIGDNPTSFEAYQGETYPFDLGQEVYGGTADVVGGVGTITHGVVDLGSLTWTYHLASGQYSDFFDCYLPNDSIVGNASVAFDGYFEIYKSIPSANIALSGYDDGVMALASGTRRFIVCDQRYTSAEALKTALNGKMLVYPLATPTPFTFTGQPINSYLGVNNVWTDSGEVLDVEYAYMPTGNSGAYFPAGSV